MYSPRLTIIPRWLRVDEWSSWYWSVCSLAVEMSPPIIFRATIQPSHQSVVFIELTTKVLQLVPLTLKPYQPRSVWLLSHVFPSTQLSIFRTSWSGLSLVESMKITLWLTSLKFDRMNGWAHLNGGWADLSTTWGDAWWLKSMGDTTLLLGDTMSNNWVTFNPSHSSAWMTTFFTQLSKLPLV